MELNDYQKTAVLDEHNACLVRANVGSGKTTVLIEKIRYLHQQKKIPLENMIVLTFTNKAAGQTKTQNARYETKYRRKPLVSFLWNIPRHCPKAPSGSASIRRTWLHKRFPGLSA